jgi:hypothetical protein
MALTVQMIANVRDPVYGTNGVLLIGTQYPLPDDYARQLVSERRATMVSVDPLAPSAVAASASAVVGAAIAQKIDATDAHLGGVVSLAQNASYTLTPGLDYSKGITIEAPSTGVGNVLCGAGVTINGLSRARRLPPGSVARITMINGNALSADITQADPPLVKSVLKVANGALDMSGAAPHRGRVLSPQSPPPAMLWEPANLGMPGTQSNCVAALNRNYMCRSQFGAVALTVAATGGISAAWSGQSINFGAQVAAGYAVGVMYVYLPHMCESLSLAFAGSGARQRILSYNWAVARQGWVALPFALPGLSASMTTSVNNALLGTNISGMSEFNGGFDTTNSTVTTVTLTISTFGMAGTAISAGEVVAVAGIDLVPKARPALMITYDKINGNSGVDGFVDLVDLHRARNLMGGVRYYGGYDNFSWGFDIIKYGTDRGFDVYNGTLTRLPLSGQTLADAYREFGVNDAQMRAGGIVPSAFYTVPGNASYPAGTFEPVMQAIGVRYSRASGLPIVPHCYGGVCQPYNMGTTGITAPNSKTITQFVQGLIDAGVHGSVFAHGMYAGANPGDGRDMTVADAIATLDVIASFQNAGLIDVVGCEGMSLILDGLA